MPELSIGQVIDKAQAGDKVEQARIIHLLYFHCDASAREVWDELGARKLAIRVDMRGEPMVTFAASGTLS